MTKPVFHEGEHVAWVVIVAHQADIGGAVPGTYNPNATDMWQEGLRITPVKISSGGERRADVWELIFGNVRLDVVADDVDRDDRRLHGRRARAERAAGDLRRSTRFRAARSRRCSTRPSAARREAIRRIADGIYRAELTVHDDGIDHDGQWTIRLAVTVAGDRITFDFAGTDAQATGYINTPRAVTISSVMIAFFMIAEGELPAQRRGAAADRGADPEGCLRQPRVPGADLLRQPRRRPARGGDHAGARAGGARAGDGRLERAAGLDRQRRRPAQRPPYVDILLNACKGGGGGTRAPTATTTSA